MTQLTNENLADFTFDSVEDLAPQGSPPTGKYSCSVAMSIDPAKNDKAPQVRLNWTINSIASQSPTSDTAAAAVETQEFTTWHSLDTLVKEGKTTSQAMVTKRLLMPFFGKYGTKNIVELASSVDDEAEVTIKWGSPVASAGKEPKRFMNVEAITLL